MIDRSTKLTGTLEAWEWDEAFNLMADGPYRKAAPLIVKLQQQFQEQVAPNESASYTNPAPPLRNNGKGRAALATSEPSA